MLREPGLHRPPHSFSPPKTLKYIQPISIPFPRHPLHAVCRRLCSAGHGSAGLTQLTHPRLYKDELVDLLDNRLSSCCLHVQFHLGGSGKPYEKQYFTFSTKKLIWWHAPTVIGLFNTEIKSKSFIDTFKHIDTV